MMDKDLIEKLHNRKHFYENIDCLEKHISKFFSNDEITVFHEMLSLDFHLDVYFIKPKDKKFNILLTSGMSLLEMQVNENIPKSEDYCFAELMILLPKDLQFEQVHTGEEKNGWIMSMLKEIARFPHHYDTWLGIGHTIQATSDLEPYDEDTRFVASVLLPSVTFDSDFTEFTSGKRKINIYSIFPLYKSELEFKLENGYSKFLDLLIKANVKEIFDNKRIHLVEE